MKHTTSRIGMSLLGITSAIACGGILVDGLGCAVAEPTALFLGVSSDMRVADDFDSVGLFISVNGEVKYQGVHPVSPTGEVLLPASLSILQPDEPSTPVHIRVAGYKASQVIAVRDAITTIPSDQISVLRLPVQWLSTGATKGRAAGAPGSATTTSVSLGGVQPRSAASDNVTFSEFAKFFSGLELPCPAGQTLVAGACESVHISPNALVMAKGGAHVGEVYGGATGLDALGNAAGGACFSVDKCFADSEAVRPEDITVRRDGATVTGCEIPRPRGASLDQFNIAIDRDGTPGAYVALNSEAPEEAKEGGWRDAGAKLSLPPAVCARLGAAARGLRVSTRCVAKRAKDPTCGPWSAVKSEQKPDFAGGRYYTEVGPVDAGAVDAGRDGPPGVVDAAEGGPVDANFDAGPPETIDVTGNSVVAPTRMAYDNGTLWIKGRRGTTRVVNVEGPGAPQVVPMIDNTNCAFGYVGARGGLGAIACHAGSRPGYFGVQVDGGLISERVPSPSAPTGAVVTEEAPVVGSIVSPNQQTYLEFLHPTRVDAVELRDGGAAWPPGMNDLFYQPVGPNPVAGSFLFTGGTHVYLARTQGSEATLMPYTIAEIPSPFSGDLTGDALFAQGPHLFFYGTNAKVPPPPSVEGVIFQAALPGASPVAADAAAPEGGTLEAGVDSGVPCPTRGRTTAAATQALLWRAPSPLGSICTSRTRAPTSRRSSATIMGSTGPTGVRCSGCPSAPRDDAGAGAVPLSGTPDPLKHTYALALSPNYVYWAAFDGAGVWSLRRVAKRPL
ncbi:MAG: hypothetical protein IPQ09_28730 [Myxococcales bacterium]|nr:hypothetical protein [Myxococcales bacterium]